MTYSTDIDTLSPNHRWSFENTNIDAIGAVVTTLTSATYIATPVLCQDATACLRTTGVGNRGSIATTTDINNSAQTRKIVGGWFRTNSIQQPPCRIYGEGNNVQSFAFILGHGNSVIFEIQDPTFNIQIYSDVSLEVDRNYHLCLVFEGNGFDNEVRAYLDGVEQLNANPVDRIPDNATLAARSVGEFGDPAGTVSIGSSSILLVAPVTGYYAQWCTWDSVSLTDTQIRETLFEKGAVPDVTISSDTQVNMQTALDVYSSTSRADAPLCIRIETVTGDGDFTLDLNSIVFDDLASIHIQYMGTGTLTLINKGTSNASITSTPNSGTVVLVQEVVITINVKDVSDSSAISGARVYIEADTGGDLVAGTEIMNANADGSGIATLGFSFTNPQPIIGKVRKGTSSTYYKTGTIGGSITSNGFTSTVLLIKDE